MLTVINNQSLSVNLLPVLPPPAPPQAPNPLRPFLHIQQAPAFGLAAPPMSIPISLHVSSQLHLPPPRPLHQPPISLPQPTNLNHCQRFLITPTGCNPAPYNTASSALPSLPPQIMGPFSARPIVSKPTNSDPMLSSTTKSEFAPKFPSSELTQKGLSESISSNKLSDHTGIIEVDVNSTCTKMCVTTPAPNHPGCVSDNRREDHDAQGNGIKRKLEENNKRKLTDTHKKVKLENNKTQRLCTSKDISGGDDTTKMSGVYTYTCGEKANTDKNTEGENTPVTSMAQDRAGSTSANPLHAAHHTNRAHDSQIKATVDDSETSSATEMSMSLPSRNQESSRQSNGFIGSEFKDGSNRDVFHKNDIYIKEENGINSPAFKTQRQIPISELGGLYTKVDSLKNENICQPKTKQPTVEPKVSKTSSPKKNLIGRPDVLRHSIAAILNMTDGNSREDRNNPTDTENTLHRPTTECAGGKGGVKVSSGIEESNIPETNESQTGNLLSVDRLDVMKTHVKNTQQDITTNVQTCFTDLNSSVEIMGEHEQRILVNPESQTATPLFSGDETRDDSDKDGSVTVEDLDPDNMDTESCSADQRTCPEGDTKICPPLDNRDGDKIINDIDNEDSISHSDHVEVTDEENIECRISSTQAVSTSKDFSNHLKRLQDLVTKSDNDHFRKDDFFHAKTQILKDSRFHIQNETDNNIFCNSWDEISPTLHKSGEQCDHQNLSFFQNSQAPRLCCDSNKCVAFPKPGCDMSTLSQNGLPSLYPFSHYPRTQQQLQQQQHQQQQQKWQCTHQNGKPHDEIKLQHHDRLPNHAHQHQHCGFYSHHQHQHHHHNQQHHHQQQRTPGCQANDNSMNSTASAFTPIIKPWVSRLTPYRPHPQIHINQTTIPLSLTTSSNQSVNYPLSTINTQAKSHDTISTNGSQSDLMTSLSAPLQNSSSMDAISLLRDHPVGGPSFDSFAHDSAIPALMNKPSPQTLSTWITWAQTRYAAISPRHNATARLNASKKAHVAPRYHCDSCNKTYSTFGGLSKHRQFHCLQHVKKDFGCKFCPKSYSSLGALKMHIRTHTLPCKCHVCGKAFSRPWLLQGHVRTHTGEKPFRCNHCGRAFADRSNLRAHLQTHAEVKKYACVKCGKTFSRMSLLNKHSDGSCPSDSINCI